MKIIFVSGVKFGYEILKYLLEKNWKFEIVICYHDSKNIFYSDIANFENLTSKYKIKLIKVQNINDEENIKIINKISPDLILVMGWSQILKNQILTIPQIGIIGSHPTELPKFRGRAPIPWSIIKNITQSALTFFWIEEGTDSGHILDQKFFSISDDDDATSIYNKITQLGKSMLEKNLELINKGEVIKIPQDQSKFIENWPKRTINDGKINWLKSALEINTLIRATTFPYPGAFTYFKNKKLIIWKSKIINDISMKPGRIINIEKNVYAICTGKDAIQLLKFTYDNIEYKNSKYFFTENDIGVVLE